MIWASPTDKGSQRAEAVTVKKGNTERVGENNNLKTLSLPCVNVETKVATSIPFLYAFLWIKFPVSLSLCPNILNRIY